MRGGVLEPFRRYIYKHNKKLYESLIHCILLIKDRDNREHLEHYGSKNSDKTIYLIRKPDNVGEGILSIFIYVMGRIDYAERNSMIPFVDLDAEGKASRFGRYFKIKTVLTREEVYQSKNVLLSGYGAKPVYPGWCNWINLDFNEQKKELIDKYIEVNEDILGLLDKERNRIHPERCLGLYMRGTDYTALKPSGHPIQPDLSDLSPYIDEYVKNLDNIYLVTEDAEIYRQVKRLYGEKVVTVADDRQWDEYDGTSCISSTVARAGGIEENNTRYILKILLLSECDSFVGGRTNGSSVACGFNGGKYRNKFVYDVGCYD